MILLSGGSRGLGQGIAQDLMDHGHIVATFSRSASEFTKKMNQDDPSHEKFYWEAIDAQDKDKMKRFVQQIYGRYGSIDALINNAAVNRDQLLSLSSDQDIDMVLDVNMRSCIYLSQYVSRVMLAQNRGNIINVSSIRSTKGYQGASVYSATKAGMDGFSRSLARELGPKGICVNSILPGFMDTDMSSELSDRQKKNIAKGTPLQRLGTVEDVVGIIRFLLSPEANFITGQSITVDGGFTC